jgi:sugar phosphate isomerase/epimerase
LGLQLAAASYGYLYRTTLEESLRSIAEHGFGFFELTPVAPHLYTPGFGAFERRKLKRLLESLNLRCTSVNPSFTDLNLISCNTEFRELTFRQLVQNMQLAHDLEAPLVVFIPGRRNALIPTPDEDAIPVLEEQLAGLLTHAERLGVVVTLENSPYGFMQTAAEAVKIASDIGHPMLKLTYDAANAFMNEDPAAGVTTVKDFIALAHISDTCKRRWMHTEIGNGEVDFAAFADALRSIGYDGKTVYELVDGEDPAGRWAADFAKLSTYGWSLSS